MTCVNQVFRGTFSLPANMKFHEIIQPVSHPGIINHYHSSRPHMHSLKWKGKWTLLLFSSGKFRIMGPIMNVDAVIDFILGLLPRRTSLSESPVLRTETFTFSIGRSINLYLFKKSNQADRLIQYEPELFSALRLLYWSPINVNVFHTGKIVVMGAKSRELLPTIYDYVNTLFSCTSQFTF